MQLFQKYVRICNNKNITDSVKIITSPILIREFPLLYIVFYLEYFIEKTSNQISPIFVTMQFFSMALLQNTAENYSKVLKTPTHFSIFAIYLFRVKISII